MDVYRELGPGLLESTYEACMLFELAERGLSVDRQKALPVVCRDVRIGGFAGVSGSNICVSARRARLPKRQKLEQQACGLSLEPARSPNRSAQPGENKIGYLTCTVPFSGFGKLSP
jgi:hypothetical protein